MALGAGYLFASFIYRGVEALVDLALLGPELRKLLRLPEQRPSRSNNRIKWVIWVLVSVVLVVMFLIGNAVILAAPFLKQAYLWAMRAFGLRATQLALGATVIVLGCGAFFFKLKHQKTYGLLEVIFAGIVGLIAARQLRPGTDWSGSIATLIGAVYIVSRGLSNINDGFVAKGKLGKSKTTAK